MKLSMTIQPLEATASCTFKFLIVCITNIVGVRIFGLEKIPVAINLMPPVPSYYNTVGNEFLGLCKVERDNV
jgi:hypothetical protein